MGGEFVKLQRLSMWIYVKNNKIDKEEIDVSWWAIYFADVSEDVQKSRQTPVAYVAVGFHSEILIPDLHRRELNPNPINNTTKTIIIKPWSVSCHFT